MAAPKSTTPFVKDFVAREEQSKGALLGTTVRIDAQDGKTFSIGSNIYDGGGLGELGAGFHGEGIVTVTHYTGKYATPTLPLSRLRNADGSPTAGEMGVRLIDGPGGPASRLDISLPFAQ